MKGIDFTKLGGYPFTQDTLDYLQTAYTEAVGALCAAGGTATGPMRISGMEVTEPTPGDVAVSDGWFIYNGNLIRFIGDTVTPGSDVALVEITNGATSLTFNNGSSHNVLLESTATVIAAASVTDATHFPVSALMPFGREKDWTTDVVINIASIGSTGSVRYKKDYFANTLQISGSVTLIDPSAGALSYPNVSEAKIYEMPVGYRPPFGRRIVGVVQAPLLLTEDSKDWLRHVNLYFDGQYLWMETPKTASGSTSYTVVFNAVVPLD